MLQQAITTQQEEALRGAAAEKSLYLLGLGANLGDCLANLRVALENLENQNARVLARSVVVLSPPMGPVAQPDFLNACAWVSWPHGPQALLDLCRREEDCFERDRSVHWGPRPLDLDLLWWSGGGVQTEMLRLPHPGLAERDFVLIPALSLVLFEELTGVSPPPEKVQHGLPVVAKPEDWGGR